ncbi:hypothetical protein BKA69DRAFT_258331 [Paraphysoderma sedebokerense]|nr:hypothetical protein BKA69DRAFT_258331 [Paraphysoderma sedebokerense]
MAPSGTFTVLVVFSAALMTYSVLSHLKRPPRKTTRKNLLISNSRQLEDVISLSALAELTKSHNVTLQASALRILLRRAVSPFAGYIVGLLIGTEVGPLSKGCDCASVPSQK